MNTFSSISAEAASKTSYDAVVVGSGVAGSIIAQELGKNGFRVLVLEAGVANDLTVANYADTLARFYSAPVKHNNSPYAENPNAPMPLSSSTRKLQFGEADASGYMVQRGPFEVDSTYTRVVGGTTRHFEAKALRMLPEDFALNRDRGQGRDWPIDYAHLEPFYRQAEHEMGVSADVEDQAYLGITFADGYVYPMHRMPPSYLDQVIAKRLDGTTIAMDDEPYTMKVRSTPQARNGVPNAAYDDGKGYAPTGAVDPHQPEMGQRCQGNNNCVPICPVQAKYDARRSLHRAIKTGRVDFLAQTVASRVEIDAANGRVTGITCKAYDSPASSEHTTFTVRARVFVLAANAIENARLMLASGLTSRSGLIGRNLMDHAYLLAWGLMPEITGTMRGTPCTSGIEDLRGGRFRQNRAAFRVSIHNDGWGWATGSPYSDLLNLVDDQNKFGRDLQQALVNRISRQLLLDFMVEVLPDQANRVSVDPNYRDQLGNMRPVLSYGVPDYTLNGIAFARRLSRRIFQRLGAEDYTSYDPKEYGWVSYQGEGYVIRGGNHWAGTHLMGTSPSNSVVDATQRSWDHQNLYLAGAGSMPTIGTANTTLTLAALCFHSAGHIVNELRSTPAVATAAQ